MNSPNPISDSSKVNKEKFEKSSRKRGRTSIIIDIYKIFWKDMILIACFSIEASFLYVYSDQQAKLFIDSLNSDDIDFEVASFHIVSSILLVITGVYLKSVNMFLTGKLLCKIRAGLVTLILEKQLEFEIKTTSEHTTGAIASYIQTDIEKSVMIVNILIYFVNGSSTILFALYFVLTSMGIWFIPVALAFIIAIALCAVGVYFNYIITVDFLSYKDQRATLTKSIIKNLKFVKSKALEYYCHYKVYAVRNVELRYLRYIFYLENLITCLPFFLGLYLPTGLYIFANYYRDSGLGRESLTTINIHFSNLIDEIEDLIKAVVEFTINFSSVVRLEKFLNSKNIVSNKHGGTGLACLIDEDSASDKAVEIS